MTREEAKQLLPIIKAFSEGKVIEARTRPDVLNNPAIPNEWTELKELEYWGNTEYRIKPEPMYRSFKDADECWQEMRKHQPFGWVIDPNMQYRQIIKLNRDTFYLDNADARFKFWDIPRNLTFADGNPFGIKEEQ